MKQLLEDGRAAFSEAYASLNAAQKEAVDTIEGPVMVIAGPGTGKTQILTLRIANILLNTDSSADSILALTFTESGARAMRERLIKYIGVEAYSVSISTFHSFCEKLIQQYPDAYQNIIGGRPARDLEKVSIVENILSDPSFKALRPRGNPSYYINSILREISEMKREYITTDKLAEIVNDQEKELADIPKVHTKGAHKGKIRGEYKNKDRSINKNRELLAIYQRYNASLFEQKLYDFEDMILETISALESNEEMLRDLQEKYQYILADEHQDVNGSQNRILEILSSYHDNPNLFVVGDEKQAIYRFQGASLENFLYFEEKFKGTKTITLTENYRSGQVILDGAHSLIAVSEGPLKELRVPLISTKDYEALVELREFSHQSVEDDWLVKQVQNLIEQTGKPEEVAIIVRTNKEVESVTSSLRNAGVSVSASADRDVLYHPIASSVISLMEAVAKPDNESVLFKVVQASYWDLDPEDRFRLLSARSFDTPLSKLISDIELLKELGIKEINKVTKIGSVISESQTRSAFEAPQRVLQYLINESGLLTNIMRDSPQEGGRILRRLYDEVESMVVSKQAFTVKDVCDQFNLLKEHNLSLVSPLMENNSQAVKVLTAHKSKGLEFEQVLIPHLSDSVWGKGSLRRVFDIPLTLRLKEEEFDHYDDEKRLLYVAMTRAKSDLYLSFSNLNSEGRELIPSRLLTSIDEEFLESIDTSDLESEFDVSTALSIEFKAPEFSVDIFKNLLRDRGFSATSLNNFLESPWTWIYRNALRIPEAQAEHQQFGTALHFVMEMVSDSYNKTGNWPKTTEVDKWLHRALGKLPVSANEYTRLHEDGLAALTVYLEYVEKNFPSQTDSEMSLRVMLPTGLPELPELLLTGKLDRLDFDNEGRVIRVVDYKTGKPKSRNEIAGNTKNSNGNYKRQLVFYALLLSLYEDQRYKCSDMTISFIQPDSKGQIHEETFTITETEITELKSTIVESVKLILSGEFLKIPCDDKVCNYCDLAKEWF